MKMKYFFALFASGFLSACNSNNMTTIIDSEGSCERIFSTFVSDKFIKGDTSENPFPVDLNGWKITWQFKDNKIRTDWPLSSWQKKQEDSLVGITAFASRHFLSVKDLSDSFRFKSSYAWKDFNIQPMFQKTFRWFFSYYTYTETFPQIPIRFPVSIDNYLTKQEAGYWLTGQPDITEGMNGLEAKELLDSIEIKSGKFFARNLFELQYKELLNNLALFPGSPAPEQMFEKKDSVFEQFYNEIYNKNKTDSIGAILNKYFHTTSFNPLLNIADERFKKILEPIEFEKLSKYFEASINYKLIMPGEVLTSNGVLVNDTLSWKIDTYRFLNANYQIAATSRKLNPWSIVILGLIIIVTAILLLRRNRLSI